MIYKVIFVHFFFFFFFFFMIACYLETLIKGIRSPLNLGSTGVWTFFNILIGIRFGFLFSKILSTVSRAISGVLLIFRIWSLLANLHIYWTLWSFTLWFPFRFKYFKPGLWLINLIRVLSEILTMEERFKYWRFLFSAKLIYIDYSLWIEK